MKRHSSTTLALALTVVLLAQPVAVAQVTNSPAATPGPPQQNAPSPTNQLPQSPPPAASPQSAAPVGAPSATQDDGEVVRITSNLVQIDAVVTDKKGRQVTDLTAEDFEIYEDERPQKITNFSYVSVVPTTPADATNVAAAPRDKNAPAPPPVRLRPEQVRRTVALVVDDLGCSFESIAYIRQALKKYVKEQLQPNDLVAVVRTGGGMGTLQQFTSDQQQLDAAIERVKWNSMGRGGIGVFEPLRNDAATPPPGMTPGGGLIRRGGVGVPGGLQGTSGLEQFGGFGGRNGDRSIADSVDDFREEIFTIGTLGALNNIIKGLDELPGRKSIVLFSDGFRTYDADGMHGRVLQAMRRLTDIANRASVIIYTIDPRGVVYTGLTAADDTSGFTNEQVQNVMSARSRALFESQSGTDILAEQTGGLALRNNNDINGALRRVLDDQKGYYLIGYRPDASTFDQAKGRGKFHKIRTKVKRPDLKLRTRGGFFGFTDDETTTKPVVKRTRNQQLYAALTSPFSSGGVPLRLTSLFHSQDEKNSYVDSLLHLDASSFTFKEEADGWHKAEVDLVALTFGDNPVPLDEVNRTATIKLRGETYQKVLKDGLTYTMRVPVKKPGAYQLRVAVRDASTERIGSASQFIQVPNLKKDWLALSGITVMGTDTMAARIEAATKATTGGEAAAGVTKEGQANDPDPAGSPAVRRFRRGASIDYLLYAYNAKLDKATRAPQLQTQVRLFREGRLAFDGQMTPFDAADQTDKKRLVVWSRLRLGTNLAPGEYALQIVVTDPLASEKRRTVAQWVDFEIVK